MAILTKIKSMLTGRDALVENLERLEAAQVVAAAERQRAIDAAQAELDALEEPRRRLERLQAEHLGAGAREAREQSSALQAVREHPSRELERFAARLDRIYARLRSVSPPPAQEETHHITGDRRITNLPAIERHNALAPVLVRMRVEIRDSLWRLSDAALRARLVELERELAAAVADTVLSDEAA